MKKNLYRMIVLFFILIYMTGCWDYKDINQRTITLSVGLDYDSKEKVQYTSEVADLSAGGIQAKEQAQSSPTYLLNSKGEDFEDARNDLNNREMNEDFSGATLLVAFSKDYAQRGIETYINRIVNLYGYRSALLIAVSRESIEELYKTKVKGSISVGTAIEETIRHISEYGGTLYSTANQVHTDISMKEMGYLLPYIGTEDNTIEYLGYSVMKDSKLIGIIERKDATGVNFLIAKNPLITKTFTIPKNKKNKVSIETKLSKRKIKTTYKEGKVQINIDLNLNAQILYFYYQKILTKEEIMLFENLISEEIKKDLLHAIKKSQKEYKVDFLKFAKYFKAQNSEIYKDIQWEEAYPRAEVNINVNTKIVDTNVLKAE